MVSAYIIVAYYSVFHISGLKMGHDRLVVSHFLLFVCDIMLPFLIKIENNRLKKKRNAK